MVIAQKKGQDKLEKQMKRGEHTMRKLDQRLGEQKRSKSHKKSHHHKNKKLLQSKSDGFDDLTLDDDVKKLEQPVKKTFAQSSKVMNKGQH